ncbi:PIN domain-containing protein [Planctomycetota bacterium]
MIALDTNIVVRLLVNDDARQVDKAKKTLQQLEKKEDTAFISDLVLLEAIWVLESGYNAKRKEIITAIEHLTTVPVFAFQDVDLVHQFVQEAEEHPIDLSDILIGLKARLADCETTLTFDKKAAKHPLFTKI